MDLNFNVDNRDLFCSGFMKSAQRSCKPRCTLQRHENSCNDPAAQLCSDQTSKNSCNDPAATTLLKVLKSVLKDFKHALIQRRGLRDCERDPSEAVGHRVRVVAPKQRLVEHVGDLHFFHQSAAIAAPCAKHDLIVLFQATLAKHIADLRPH